MGVGLRALVDKGKLAVPVDASTGGAPGCADVGLERRVAVVVLGLVAGHWRLPSSRCELLAGLDATPAAFEAALGLMGEDVWTGMPVMV